MNYLDVIDRATGQRFKEQVYGGNALQLLYGSHTLARWMGRPLSHFVSRLNLCSSIYGWWQRQRWTASKVQPFIDAYGVDATEFLDPIESFKSFNDFFIRKLKAESRPIAPGNKTAIIPADGRYYFYAELDSAQLLDVKGRRLDLIALLGDAQLAARYTKGSVVMARLCPSDYHRFHFPIACVPSTSRLINGPLYSVNPIAVRQNLNIMTQNKRKLSTLTSDLFGEVLCIEVGATNVGSIHETYQPKQPVRRGDEKGYFSFGGSAMIILFPPGKITIDGDLLAATQAGLEVRCLFGQSMGQAH